MRAGTRSRSAPPASGAHSRPFVLFRRRREPDDLVLPDALRTVRDALAAGCSLAQALRRAGEVAGSPFAAVIRELDAGLPLDTVLEREARSAPSPELAFTLLLLSVQARTGGDPAPAIAALTDRIRSRLAAAREARTLTTQSRMSARALLLLTPGFLCMLFALDPAGTVPSLVQPGSRLALATGLALQVAGAVVTSRIVASPFRVPSAPTRWRAIPVLRAVSALMSGGDQRRRDRAVADALAGACDVMALSLDAGLSQQAALELAARATPHPAGAALAGAVSAVRAGARRTDALREAATRLGGRDAERFAAVFESGTTLGVPVAPSMRALADDIRSARSAEIAEDVRRASVKVLVPLCLLILPAFVLACLVPVFLNGLRGISL